MNELIDYIDTQIKSCVPEVNSFGLCQLIESDNKRFPATLETDAKEVTPDKRYNVIMYHRIIGGSPANENESMSFGRNPTRKHEQKVRSVVFIRYGLDQKIDDIINAYPNSFNTSSYYFANVSSEMSLNVDSDSIWKEEYKDAYQDKYKMVFRLFAIEFNTEYVRCNGCV